MKVQIKSKAKENVDHWAFLEEIEAPMWVDLTLEPQVIVEDNGDEWFHTSHQFHHHSSRELRSAFAHLDVGSDFFNINLQGVSSPKLPSSVSKSRGKDYRSKTWGSNFRVSLNKGHLVNDLGRGISRLITEDQNRACGSNSSLTCDKSSTENVTSSSELVVDDSNTRVAVGSKSVSSSEEVSTSSLTVESGWRSQLKRLETSKEAFGHTGGLLNALKTNLRKSCATRPALRVEICDDRGLKGRKSSAGKSSVGSSNSGYDVKSKVHEVVKNSGYQRKVKAGTEANRASLKSSSGKSTSGSLKPRMDVKKVVAGSMQNKDRTLSGRNLGNLAQPVKGRVKSSDVVEASSHARNANRCRIEGRDAAAVATRQQADKSKVPLQKTQRNSLFKDEGAKSKAKNNQLHGSSCNGKENMRGRVALSQRFDARNNRPVVKVSDQEKPPKLKLKNKVDTAALVGSKVRTGKGNNSKLFSDAHPVYLR